MAPHRKKLILIDGNALVHRAFHALPPLTSPQGLITNAVFGFCSILIRIIKDLQPDYIAATFDLAGGTVRHKEFTDYKAHRPKAPQELYDQIPMVKELLGYFGIPIFEMQDYEADDVIGTLATKAKQEKNLQVIIATGDLDTLQLVDDDKVVVFTLRKGVNDTITYNEDSVKERFGLKPEQMNDYKGLKGDPSDNIPGVAGVGEKTASSLVQEFGSIEKMYEELEKPTSTHKISEKLKEKLLTHKDMAMLSKQLSTIYTDLDIEFSLKNTDWQKNLDRNKIEQRFKELGFATLIKRVHEITVHAVQPGLELFDSAPAEIEDTTSTDIPALEKLLPSAKWLAIHAISDNEVVVAPDNHNAFKGTPKAFKAIFGDGSIPKIGHYVKPLYKLLLEQDITLTNIAFDTQLAMYLLNPEQRDFDFGKLYYQELGTTLNTNPYYMPIEILKLASHLESKLKDLGLEKLLHTMDLPLVPVVARMERHGIKINLPELAELLKSTNKELAKLEKEIYKLAGDEFNINSPAQLGVILFDTLGITGRVKRTSGGVKSTAAPELEKLRDEHPIIDFVLQYRELQKLKTTYIEPFPHLVHEDGRIHTTYNQTGTATGRVASQDPNLQNIPTRTELGQEFRKAFIPEKGYTLVACDYSQIDLRVVAHLAQDPIMIKAFRDGEDIHARTASQILGVPADEVTKEMRRRAKVLNFGVLYGMGPMAFMRAAKVTRQEAQDFIKKYFEEFAGVAKFIEATKQQAYEEGFTATLFGRRRSALDVHATMPQLRAQAERMAVNHPVQGTSADLVRMAMIHIDEFIQKEYPNDEVRMLLQVHDELVFEVKDTLVEELAPKLKKLMETVYKLDVPLLVEPKAGENWSEMKAID